MRRTGILAAVLLLGLGCPRPPVRTGISARIHPWGEPRPRAPSGITLRNTAYDCCYSPELHVSRWVAYPYTRTGLWLDRFDGDFRPDPRLDTVTGPSTNDFQSIWTPDLEGFDRGHQAPDGAIRVFGREAQAETYFLTNITPQYSRFNRGFWRELEYRTRGWAGEHDTVWVVTGPVFLPGRDTLRVGRNRRVAVPHAYFEVVARRRPTELLAMVVPHDPADIGWNSASVFLVSVDSVERLTGFDFFPYLHPATAARLESAPLPALWPGSP